MAFRQCSWSLPFCLLLKTTNKVIKKASTIVDYLATVVIFLVTLTS